MSKTVHYYLSLISPYTYLAQPRMVALGQEDGVNVVYKPFDIGTVFGEIGTKPPGQRHASLQAYRLLELARWSKEFGLPMNMQPKFFPSPSNLASAMLIAAQDAGSDVSSFASLVLQAVWADELNINDEATLVDLGNQAGLDGAALLATAQGEAAQAQFKSITQEALDAGVFGSPTLAIEGELFWGQDRIDLAQKTLGL